MARPLGGEPHLRQQAAHLAGNRGARRARHLQRERDVLLGGAVLEEAEILEHDSELAPQERHVTPLHRARVHAGHAHLSGRRQLLHGHELEDRRFAGPARSREEGELALGEAEAHVVEREPRAGILLGDVLESNHGTADYEGAGPIEAGSPSASSRRQLCWAVTVSSTALSSPMTTGPSRMPTIPKV